MGRQIVRPGCPPAGQACLRVGIDHHDLPAAAHGFGGEVPTRRGLAAAPLLRHQHHHTPAPASPIDGKLGGTTVNHQKGLKDGFGSPAPTHRAEAAPKQRRRADRMRHTYVGGTSRSRARPPPGDEASASPEPIGTLDGRGWRRARVCRTEPGAAGTTAITLGRISCEGPPRGFSLRRRPEPYTGADRHNLRRMKRAVPRSTTVMPPDRSQALAVERDRKMAVIRARLRPGQHRTLLRVAGGVGAGHPAHGPGRAGSAATATSATSARSPARTGRSPSRSATSTRP